MRPRRPEPGTEAVLVAGPACLAGPVRMTPAQQFDGLWHLFQLHAGVLRESDAAIAQIGHFIRQATGPTSACIAPDATKMAAPVQGDIAHRSKCKPGKL
ncbi:hypothetical protein A9975_17405 [Cupriavidus sp. UME77]|nr:hypothetical protein [Cupriavidus sp. UME77]